MSLLFAIKLLLSFLNTGSLTYAAAQIIELTTADSAATNNVNGLDYRGMKRENSFNAYAVRETTNGESFLNVAVLLSDNSTLEGLYTGLLAFLNANAYTNDVTDIEFGNFLLEALVRKNLHCIHF